MNECKRFNRNALLINVMEDVAAHLNGDTSFNRDDPDGNPRSVACHMLLKSLFKKWLPDGDDLQRAESNALLKFLEANHASEEWALKSDQQRLDIQNIKLELDRFFHEGPRMIFDSYSDILSEAHTGPGSSVGAVLACNYAKLYSSQMTTTSLTLYNMYKAYVDLFPVSKEAEELRQLEKGTCRIVNGSNVSFAPKQADCSRLICTEPSINMYFQLGLKNVLERRLGSFWGIYMDSQPEINRLLAREGSISGKFSTIDLSSASDLISVSLCREILPSWFFETLMELRSPTCNIQIYGLERSLGMISTMGNGFTFPLMTIILGAVIRVAYKNLGIRILRNRINSVRSEPVNWIHSSGSNNDPIKCSPGNWGVFGDDLICEQSAYDEVCRILSSCGLKVNGDKSFKQGPFRESCGHDYFMGHNVRGVYLKRVDTVTQAHVAINLLNDWTQRTGVPLPSAVRYILSCFRDKVLYVPYVENVEAGIRVPSSFFGNLGARMTSYRCYRSVPRKLRIEDCVISFGRKGRLLYNPPGLLNSLLGGELRNGTIFIRNNPFEERYRKRRHVVPWWDYMPTSIWIKPHIEWRRFETAVAHNLGNPRA